MPDNHALPHATRAFVDYYNAQDIIPVRQDTTDRNFLFRRDYLYKTLGIPLWQIKNRNVIEFGPGGGFNAVATTFYGPASYVFVDATKVSIAELERKNALGCFKARHVEIVESDIFDYRDSRRYDLVICEGVIPCQDKPQEMLRHVASFCDEGGILILTTMSASSLLSEICRRVLRPSIMRPGRSFSEQSRMGVKLFQNHLRALGTSTRPAEDWVQDMILHDWHKGKYVFTMLDAAAAIADDFEFYSSSPRFLLDGRWYKHVTADAEDTNSLLRQQYVMLDAFLLDFRLPLRDVLQIKDVSRLAAIAPLCEAACVVHDAIVTENSYDRLEDFVGVLNELRSVLPEEFKVTEIALGDFINGIRILAMNENECSFGSFESWWGRGQQYASFSSRMVSQNEL